MGSHKISVIPGDGIGVEVIAEGLRVLERVAATHELILQFEHHPWGSRYYFEHGTMMPAEGLDCPSIEELRAFARDALASYKLPRRVVAVSTLPRNALGKVMRHELRLADPD